MEKISVYVRKYWLIICIALALAITLVSPSMSVAAWIIVGAGFALIELIPVIMSNPDRTNLDLLVEEAAKVMKK